uniref:Uncharacterized protein n=1 Tax=Oryza meridionalis TaxID=40149 RepID=A0A0E0D2T1_9ORYZ
MDRCSPVLHGLLRPPSHAATAAKGGAGHRRAAVGSGAERSAAGGARRQGRAGGRPCGPPTTESVLHTASRDASAAAPLLPALPLEGLDDVLSLLSPTSPPNHLVLGPPHRGSRPLSLTALYCVLAIITLLRPAFHPPSAAMGFNGDDKEVPRRRRGRPAPRLPRRRRHAPRHSRHRLLHQPHHPLQPPSPGGGCIQLLPRRRCLAPSLAAAGHAPLLPRWPPAVPTSSPAGRQSHPAATPLPTRAAPCPTALRQRRPWKVDERKRGGEERGRRG